MYAWLPAVEKAGVPSPGTEMVYLGWRPMMDLMDYKPLPKRDGIEAAGQRIGYPLFLRTDLASGKHNWRESCYVPSPDDLWRHIYSVIEFNFMADIRGLGPVGLAFREFIPLDSAFTAFQGMPVARERRYFAENGIVQCHHPYWIAGAIAEYRSHNPPLPEDWRERLTWLNHESTPEIERLSSMAKAVSLYLDGAWSIDFARTQKGKWYLIDMALAEESWHPECAAGVHYREVR